jgi:hypothetical protein
MAYNPQVLAFFAQRVPRNAREYSTSRNGTNEIRLVLAAKLGGIPARSGPTVIRITPSIVVTIILRLGVTLY